MPTGKYEYKKSNKINNMTNLEIAQEQITKEKEEKRIQMIKNCLIKKEEIQRRIEELQKEIKKIDEEVDSLENSDITLNIFDIVNSNGSIAGFDWAIIDFDNRLTICSTIKEEKEKQK
jgi:hypothetical protein